MSDAVKLVAAAAAGGAATLLLHQVLAGGSSDDSPYHHLDSVETRASKRATMPNKKGSRVYKVSGHLTTCTVRNQVPADPNRAHTQQACVCMRACVRG